MAARSVPECGAAGAQGWNIDYLTPSRCLSPVQAELVFAVERGGCGVRCLTRCWVLKDRTTQCWACSYGSGSGGVPAGFFWSWAPPIVRVSRAGCGVPVVF